MQSSPFISRKYLVIITALAALFAGFYTTLHADSQARTEAKRICATKYKTATNRESCVYGFIPGYNQSPKPNNCNSECRYGFEQGEVTQQVSELKPTSVDLDVRARANCMIYSVKVKHEVYSEICAKAFIASYLDPKIDPKVFCSKYKDKYDKKDTLIEDYNTRCLDGFEKGKVNRNASASPAIVDTNRPRGVETNGFLDVAIVAQDPTAGNGATTSYMKKIPNYILQIEPYTTLRDRIAFHIITTPVDCANATTEQDSLGNTTASCSATNVEAVVAAAGVPADKIIVVLNSKVRANADLGGRIARVSSPQPTEDTSDNQSSSLTYGNTVVAHEFGHLMGLQDEYVYDEPREINGQQVVDREFDPLSRPSTYFGLTNCSMTNSEPSWQEFGTVRQEGCTWNAWFRSSENSLMRMNGVAGDDNTGAQLNTLSRRMVENMIYELTK